MRRLGLLGLVLVALLQSACAGLALRDPLNVDVAGIEQLAGQGMEGRFLVKLRVQNPNELPIEYDGIYLELDVRGTRLATGVSNERGTVARFGESVIAVPVSVPVSALVRQALGFATGDRSKVDYRLRGKLAGPDFGGVRFESAGEIALPPGLAGTRP